MRQGLTAHWAIGGRILERYWLALQVKAYHKMGRIEEAFDVLTEALAVTEKIERASGRQSYIGRKANSCWRRKARSREHEAERKVTS
jgi:hypothetical protein